MNHTYKEEQDENEDFKRAVEESLLSYTNEILKKDPIQMELQRREEREKFYMSMKEEITIKQSDQEYIFWSSKIHLFMETQIYSKFDNDIWKKILGFSEGSISNKTILLFHITKNNKSDMKNHILLHIYENFSHQICVFALFDSWLEGKKVGNLKFLDGTEKRYEKLYRHVYKNLYYQEQLIRMQRRYNSQHSFIYQHHKREKELKLNVLPCLESFSVSVLESKVQIYKKYPIINFKRTCKRFYKISKSIEW